MDDCIAIIHNYRNIIIVIIMVDLVIIIRNYPNINIEVY